MAINFRSFSEQQSYMHEFSADRDLAICNIQDRTIPVAQLMRFSKGLIINVKGTGVLSSLQ
jgi:hypothetical protein